MQRTLGGNDGTVDCEEIVVRPGGSIEVVEAESDWNYDTDHSQQECRAS